MYTLAADVRARIPPDAQCFLVVTELDADLFKNGVGIVFDKGEALFVENFELLDLARNVAELLYVRGLAAGPARLCASAGAAAFATGLACAVSFSFTHVQTLRSLLDLVS